MRDFVEKIIKTLGFSKTEYEYFESIYAVCEKELVSLASDYVFSTLSQEDIINKAYNLCSNFSKTAVATAFQLLATEPLFELYKQKGVCEAVFYNTVKDIKRKFNEGRDLFGVIGTVSESWQRGFFRLNRVSIGYFQYDLNYTAQTDYNNHGVTVKKGEQMLRFHMPSGEDFSESARLNSYKLAYEFFKDRLKNGLLVVDATSWLLYPNYSEVFDKGNVYGFRKEVEIVNSFDFKEFNQAFRIFGLKKDLPVVDLPENTSMQRKFKKYLLENKPHGYAQGYLLFDGENILTKN